VDIVAVDEDPGRKGKVFTFKTLQLGREAGDRHSNGAKWSCLFSSRKGTKFQEAKPFHKEVTDK
jgi:hypothetical protein